jgi:hypothetical protein
MVPETSWWWCESGSGCYGWDRLPFQSMNQGDSYVRVYWCLISIRLSVSCEPAILLHHAGICLTWNNVSRE